MTDSTDDAPQWRSPITTAGMYENIPMEEYHGNEICPGPSISSSGLRTIEAKSLFHFWYDSPLNPDRPKREEKRHFVLGRLLHELLEHGQRAWRNWHVLPDGYSEHHVKKWEKEIAQARALVEQGVSLVRFDDAQTAEKMAKGVLSHPRGRLLFQSGIHEPTLVWKDSETGIWLRVRPDFFPNMRRWIPDYKSTASAHPDAFTRSVDNFGYHMAAALYLDGIRELFDERPEGFLFVAQEKDEPYVTEIFQLDEEAIAYGRSLNRASIRKYADALEKDRWPTYGAAVNLVMLPDWSRRKLELRVATGEIDVPGSGDR